LARPASAPSRETRRAPTDSTDESLRARVFVEVAPIESFQKRDRDRKKLQKRTEKDARRKERSQRRRDSPATPSAEAPLAPPTVASLVRSPSQPGGTPQ
jgi:hypothetical protein